ncbi:MAG: hypothetical protein COV36_06055 [Alphaproteobacteria bacterium CG11_big_fil_rev_8_21_14_0_20_44_7]|nr:MAG: hypothetical protein COV36_06055 [Alphaproteobacteria bacterium CG11_big_fil_rev_8_21_14_0_20_44_7]
MTIKRNFTIATSAAIIAIAASPFVTKANAEEAKKQEKEKCYGIAKSGKNDCGWSGGSCAGSATEDGLADSWIFLPKGTCDKIVGASLEAAPAAE